MLPTLKFQADRRTLSFLVAQLALTIVAFSLGTGQAWLAIAAWVVVLCVLAFITAVITHNTVHVPMFNEGWANRWAQLWISLQFGNSVSVFVRGHNFSHHRHTQTPRDLMRTSKARFRWNLLNQIFFLFLVVPAIESGNKVFIKREKDAGSRWYKQFIKERWGVRLLTIAFLVINWKAALVFVLLPRYFGIWAITGINYAQHDGCDATSPVNHSRNFVGHFENWWLLNNGFHTIHHEEPQLHWSLTREAHMAKLHGHIHPKLEDDLFGFHFRQYIWPGKRLDFLGNPVVLPPPSPDENWIPETAELEHEISIGAAGIG